MVYEANSSSSSSKEDGMERGTDVGMGQVYGRVGHGVVVVVLGMICYEVHNILYNKRESDRDEKVKQHEMKYTNGKKTERKKERKPTVYSMP